MDYKGQPLQLTRANSQDFEKIVHTLKNGKLVYADLNPDLPHFFIARIGDEFLGCIGLEIYGNHALLRSMWVEESHRSNGLAKLLVSQLEHYATSLGLDDMYLLTETAEIFFGKRGYQIVDRSRTPEALKASGEFKSLCPASAKLMIKKLSTPK